MTPLIYYSLALTGTPADTGRIFQLLYSLFSLRAQNRELPVRLFVFGELDPLMGHFLAMQLGVTSLRCGSYAEALDALCPGAGRVLGDYPILHKFLAMAQLPEASQILYVDSDTYFFADPALLFAACREAELYAREEPHSRRSPLGYSPAHLDDEAFARLAAAEGARYVQPFNTGVMLLNHGIWARFAELLPRFVALCRDFSTGRPDGLAYPAGDLWIRDQLAFWLCLGLLPGFSQIDLRPDQLLIGCEEMVAWGHWPRPVISHYFGANTYGFFARLKENPYRGPLSEERAFAPDPEAAGGTGSELPS